MIGQSLPIKERLNVALVQADPVWEDWPANQRYYDGLLSSLTTDVDLVVLPEMFSSGFTQSPGKVAQSSDGATVTWMQQQSARLDCVLVGSVVTQDEDKYYNRLFWVFPDGSTVTYDKKHLFTFAGEHHNYSAGDRQCVVDVYGWKFASFICFDLRFPAWCRNTEQQFYDAALFVASWPESRREHWMALLRARAIENQAYVVAVNRVGIDGNDFSYSGDSQVVDAMGRCQVHLSHQESVHFTQLDKTALTGIRSQFPFLPESDPFTL
ncbi:nitrilase-related carbon-nitrogen hydrolase [Halioxenophilus aromaticivorans]|uniref:Omega-amidase YafV n=1 Tax=Halioxenophilus aromaticivorans TaxID=1306992 RepID=A0AAV3U638_9ALTE